MAQQTLETFDNLPTSRTKLNANFTELYAGTVASEYDSVAELTADADITSITTGDYVRLNGYYTAGDFGQPIRLRVEASTGGVKSHALNDGRYANLYASGPYDIRWWGAKDDASFDGSTVTGTDASSALQDCVTAVQNPTYPNPVTIYIPSNTVFQTTVTLNGNITFIGDGSSFSPNHYGSWFWPNGSDTLFELEAIASRENQYLNISFQNITFRSNRDADGATLSVLKTRKVFFSGGRARITTFNASFIYFDIAFYVQELIASNFDKTNFNRNNVSMYFNTDGLSGATTVSTTVSIKDCSFNGNYLHAIRADEGSLNYLEIGGFTYFEAGNDGSNYEKYDVKNGGSCQIDLRSGAHLNITAMYVEQQDNGQLIYYNDDANDDANGGTPNNSRAVVSIENLRYFGNTTVASPNAITINTCKTFTIGKGCVFRQNGTIITLGKNAQRGIIYQFEDNYSIGTPSARANTTAYVLGDVIYVGNTPWFCKKAGTSAASEPAGYTTAASLDDVAQLDIVDGTAEFRVLGTVANYYDVYDSVANPHMFIGMSTREISVGSLMGSRISASNISTSQLSIETADSDAAFVALKSQAAGMELVDQDSNAVAFFQNTGKAIFGGGNADKDNDHFHEILVPISGTGTYGLVVKGDGGTDPQYHLVTMDNDGTVRVVMQAGTGSIFATGDLRMTSPGYSLGRIRSGNNYLYTDTSNVWRLTSGSAPSSDGDGATISNEEYKSGSGTPVGSVTPDYIRQEYLDTTGTVWYKATGLTNSDWVALN